jgi:soluble lytic murein transglycosylase-like protein/TolA-binding protein
MLLFYKTYRFAGAWRCLCACLCACLCLHTLWPSAARAERWSEVEVPPEWPSLEEVSVTEPARMEARWAALAARLEGPLRPLAALGEAVSALQAGRYLRASEALERADGGLDPLRDLQLFVWAEALFHQGRYEEARDRLLALERERVGSLWSHRARFRLADVRQALGDHAGAAEALRGLLGRYAEYPYQKSATLQIALNEIAAERPLQALEALLSLEPGSPQDLSVRLGAPLIAPLSAALSARPPSHDQAPPKARLARVRAWRDGKYYERALAELRALLADLPTQDALWPDAALEEVRILNKMERFEEAVSRNRALRAALPAGWRRTNLWWEAEATFRLGDVLGAARLFESSRVSPRTPGNQARLGMIYFNGARYQESLRPLDVASKQGSKGDKDLWVPRRARSWLSYRLGRYDEAIKGFARAGGGLKGKSPYAQYWRARSLQQRVHPKHAQSDQAEALATYQAIIARHPTDYYAYLAAERLREAGVTPLLPWSEGPPLTPHTPSSPPPTSPPPSSPPPHPLSALAPFAQAHGGDLSAWEAAYGLTLIGARRWAAIYLRALIEEHSAYHGASKAKKRKWSYAPRFYLDNRKDKEYGVWGETSPTEAPRPPAWTQALTAHRARALKRALAPTLRALDDNYYARRVAFYSGRPLTRPEVSHEREEWQRRFPRSYQREVEQSAARHGVDPHLLWALMTVESAHNPWAISVVGARGLMQVMPHTGQLSADRLSLPYFGPALLFEPEVAIEMAAWYFKELLANFHGQLPLAMAAYNAGPHRVKVWLEFKGHLPLDELIEEIPYAQAREYAKKVTRHLALYRRIYEGHTGHLLDLKVNPLVQGNINF